MNAVGLPWTTELVLGENAFRDLISGSTPGFAITCVTLLGNIKDECRGETSMALQNASSGVESSFDEASAALTCSVGGAGSGKLGGKALITDLLGALSVSEE